MLATFSCDDQWNHGFDNVISMKIGKAIIQSSNLHDNAIKFAKSRPIKKKIMWIVWQLYHNIVHTICSYQPSDTMQRWHLLIFLIKCYVSVTTRVYHILLKGNNKEETIMAILLIIFGILNIINTWWQYTLILPSSNLTFLIVFYLSFSEHYLIWKNNVDVFGRC